MWLRKLPITLTLALAALVLLPVAGAARQLTGEAYLVLGDGRVVPAAGVDLYVFRADSLVNVSARAIAKLYWDDFVPLAVSPPEVLSALLQAHEQRFLDKIEKRAASRAYWAERKKTWAADMRREEEENDNRQDWAMKFLQRYADGDVSALFDPDFNAVAFAGVPDNLPTRWNDEDNETPRNEQFDMMLLRLQYLLCLTGASSDPRCTSLAASIQQPAEPLRRLRQAQRSAVTAKVGMDGKFNLSVLGSGSFLIFGAYENKFNRGLWLVPLTVVATGTASAITLNNDNFTTP